MPLDFEKLAEVMVALVDQLVNPARRGGDRLASRSEAHAPGTRREPDSPAGADPVLSRRMSELEEEVRGLKDKLAALPEGNPSRLAADMPWRGTKEKV